MPEGFLWTHRGAYSCVFVSNDGTYGLCLDLCFAAFFPPKKHRKPHVTGERCLKGMTHDGKRDGWETLLGVGAVRKVISGYLRAVAPAQHG